MCCELTITMAFAQCSQEYKVNKSRSHIFRTCHLYVLGYVTFPSSYPHYYTAWAKIHTDASTVGGLMNNRDCSKKHSRILTLKSKF
jgi:hypothetical protein